MKLLMVLVTDKDQFITQVESHFPEHELELPAVEFSFRNCVHNKAIEQLQAEGRFQRALRRCHAAALSAEVH